MQFYIFYPKQFKKLISTIKIKQISFLLLYKSKRISITIPQRLTDYCNSGWYRICKQNSSYLCMCTNIDLLFVKQCCLQWHAHRHSLRDIRYNIPYLAMLMLSAHFMNSNVEFQKLKIKVGKSAVGELATRVGRRRAELRSKPVHNTSPP